MELEICVADDATLLSKEFKYALARRLKALRMSRHGTTKWLLELLWDHRDQGGTVLDERKRPIYLGPDLEERAYGDDLSCSYNTDIKIFADRLPKIGTRRSLLFRMQCFDAAFRIIGQPLL